MTDGTWHLARIWFGVCERDERHESHIVTKHTWSVYPTQDLLETPRSPKICTAEIIQNIKSSSAINTGKRPEFWSWKISWVTRSLRFLLQDPLPPSPPEKVIQKFPEKNSRRMLRKCYSSGVWDVTWHLRSHFHSRTHARHLRLIPHIKNTSKYQQIIKIKIRITWIQPLLLSVCLSSTCLPSGQQL